MNVSRSNMRREEAPISMGADRANRIENDLAACVVQYIRVLSHQFFFGSEPFGICREPRRTGSVMLSIDRATLASVNSRTVTGKRDQIG